MTDPLKAFHLARLDATAYGTWQICWFKRCRRARKCLGGPRGTFSKYAQPLCARNGDHAERERCPSIAAMKQEGKLEPDKHLRF